MRLTFCDHGSRLQHKTASRVQGVDIVQYCRVGNRLHPRLRIHGHRDRGTATSAVAAERGTVCRGPRALARFRPAGTLRSLNTRPTEINMRTHIRTPPDNYQSHRRRFRPPFWWERDFEVRSRAIRVIRAPYRSWATSVTYSRDRVATISTR